MTINKQVFIDANVLLYALDETSEFYQNTVQQINDLQADGTLLCSSHHVIEEVVHVAHKVAGVSASDVVMQIQAIPHLILVEPHANIAFAERYAALHDTHFMGVNDALLLQLIIDAGIPALFSYDRQLIERARRLSIASIIE